MRFRHQRLPWLPFAGIGAIILIRRHVEQHVRRLDQYDVGDPWITE
jgi:hypothetical protein